jgi:hypothetical protein
LLPSSRRCREKASKRLFACETSGQRSRGCVPMSTHLDWRESCCLRWSQAFPGARRLNGTDCPMCHADGHPNGEGTGATYAFSSGMRGQGIGETEHRNAYSD